MPTANARRRAASLAALSKLGFKVAPSLPVVRDTLEGLRPAEEIARRLMALQALVVWVAVPEEAVGSADVRAYAKRNRLESALTPKERAVFRLARAKARAGHADTIGWRLENMWPLAWALGFPSKPPADGELIPDRVVHRIMNFAPGFDGTLAGFLRRARPRPEAAVAALEDLFYCAHNAARSAALGGKTAPRGFDPVTGAGVIEERRHALSWCLARGAAWDDTDLST